MKAKENRSFEHINKYFWATKSRRMEMDRRLQIDDR
jgi:hypothetical protein